MSISLLVYLQSIQSRSCSIREVHGSLSSKYAAFQTAWDNVPADMQTLENLQERLIREEIRFSVDDEAPEAFAASKRTSARKSGKPNAGDSKKSYAEDSRENRDRKTKRGVLNAKKKGILQENIKIKGG